MLARDIMTVDPITVSPEGSLRDAAFLMLNKRISGLPVTSEDMSLCGIVTESDFLRRCELGTEPRRSTWLELLASPGKLADEYRLSHGRKVGQAMTCWVETVTPEATLAQIIELMLHHHIKHVPVVENGKLVGMITRADVLRAAADSIPPDSATVQSTDARIHESIMEELRAQPWGTAFVRIGVARGVVTMSGTIYDERARSAIQVICENVPGVRSVKDELAFAKPISERTVFPNQISSQK